MEKSQLDELIRSVDRLRALYADMPMTQALSLLLIAKHEGITLSDLAKKTKIGMASASRYVAAFSRPTKSAPNGFGFVVANEDPEDRRQKNISLTAKGRTFVNSLLEN